MNNTTNLIPVVGINDEINQNINNIKVQSNDINKGVLILDSNMPSFLQTSLPCISSITRNYGNGKCNKYASKKMYNIEGNYLDEGIGKELYCPICGHKLSNNGTSNVGLNHLPFGEDSTKLLVKQRKLRCSNKDCNYSYTYHCDFKAQYHNITSALEIFTSDLLAFGLNLTSISFITGLSRQVIKAIDLERLKEKYTVDGISLKKPDSYSKYLAIDEFKLHNGYKYATVIIDLETGHILWLAHGKKKDCVYNFFKHVGEDFMKHVEALACDMNSDFEEAFKDKYPHISIIYDRFHIMKNFNDKVISEIRKDEQKRLKDEGNVSLADSLKHSKYILTSCKQTRIKHEQDAANGKLVSKASSLFNKPEQRAKGNMEEKYKELIANNELLFTVDLVKEQLNDMFNSTNETDARNKINEIIETCKGTNNNHFIWFGKLLENHLEGIISYPKYHLSTSKLEGINNMIKTERRLGYGYPDDEYFFLKIIDRSRKNDNYKRAKDS